jgi:aminoglycoside phosphotransferase (APT) family kinase protein
MVREANLQRALRPLGAPVPQILAVCEHDAYLGVPYYVMQYVEGSVITRVLPPWLNTSPTERRRLSETLVDALADIHSIDVAASALDPFRRSGNYLERQVRRFIRLWEETATRTLPDVTAVGRWLSNTVPEPIPPRVVHGDFRLGNVLIAPEAPARVAAVLDWEMGTLGDARADLAYMCVTYSDRRSQRTVMELSPVTRLDGFLGRDELIDRYASRAQQPVGDIRWFEVLALWKSAVFLEAIYRRYLCGDMDHDELAPALERGVPEIASVASALRGP